MPSPQDPEAGHRPDYPPKTPPPPKKPVEPPRPETRNPEGDEAAEVMARPRPRVRIANRRAANWTYESALWSAARAGRNAAAQLRAWGYPVDDGHTAAELTVRLVVAAVGDGGSRISVHLADQDHRALVLVLSHRPGLAPLDQGLLPEIAALGVVSCGADTDQQDGGRRRWALLAL
ncbi:hypothetical protein [Streptomyces sp. SP18CS02]|uniref:hypothetical protein n=1 Tax=Streptomyces sp. SP18CS02 TaxID=3002531 RepID=UPI002E76C845|nr:hypothetical protein [Streptomyces sp. SP18CS02]MEE1751388.1 hypothetical protein [Streptomyces sp. SP18CS02]